MTVLGKIGAVAAILAGLASPPAMAQTSIDDIEAALGGAAEELQRVDDILAHSDANRRLAGMELLLASGNPTYVRRAKEVGLFSSDPYLRSAALKAVLEGGGALTFELDTSGLGEELLASWARKLSGDGVVAPDGSSIAVTFRLGGFDAKNNCYLILNSKNCMVVLEGENVAITWVFYRFMQGLTRLNESGELVGSLTFSDNSSPRGSVPVRVNLMN